MYTLLWLGFFLLNFHNAISGNLIFLAYNSFNSAPRIASANILATVISSVLKIPIGKTMKLPCMTGKRSESLIFFVSIFEIGIMVIGTSQSSDIYAIGFVFYWIGYNGIHLILDMFVADTSSEIFKNGAFGFAFSCSPTLISAFCGAWIATRFMNGIGWRWGFYIFAPIVVLVFFPLVVLLKLFDRESFKVGLLKESLNAKDHNEQNNRRPIQRWFKGVIDYIEQFDIIGACLLMSVFIVFLIPFSSEVNGKVNYGKTKFIVMVTIGGLLFPSFFLWERYLAKVTLASWSLLVKNRTAVAACLLSGCIHFSIRCLDQYYYNYNMVVYGMTTTYAGYMLQIFSVGSIIWTIILSFWIKHVKNFKWTAMLIGLPFVLLGTGLSIHFRGVDSINVVLIIISQTLNAFGGCTLIICWDMASMSAATNPVQVSSMLAINGLFYALGGALGSGVSASIYTNTFPQYLESHLPLDNQKDYYDIYMGGYSLQTTFPHDSAIRQAVDNAWFHSQKYGAIAATSTLALAIPCIFVWRNVELDKKHERSHVVYTR
ncbi:unnamed protein product [Ambrosiozyma monospora]|uniref:Unnamed protein product n=1 Tax=Ambrosiozyma monospora TaxID=43982 RepID=A0A9W6Z277_AMBMO|nr:unnamed protein product [Ambrosiozyma monospora]